MQSCSVATTSPLNNSSAVAAKSSATWHESPDRLDRVIPALGLARSRSHAAELISQLRVSLDGSVVTKAGTRVETGTEVTVEGASHYVSRAAQKLLVGLDAFQVDPSGLIALDVGASTGGFTQVLLERGAREVLAIDVGHGQLAELLRADDRVRVVEGCNARDLTAESLTTLTGVAQAPQVVVADISFISLDLVFPALARVAASQADLVLLVKPQFEVGRQGISGGIVTDPELAIAAVVRVIGNAAKSGLECRGVALSPITGEHGNREVLAHFVSVSPAAPVDPTEWEERIRALFYAGGEV